MNIVRMQYQYKVAAVACVGLAVSLLIAICAYSHPVGATPQDGKDFETTSPGTYPTWTIVSQRTEEKTITINHPRTGHVGNGFCTSGPPGGSSVYEVTTITRRPPQNIPISKKTVKRVQDGQSRQCTKIIREAWTETRKETTKYYTMRLVPFTYTPTTTVDKPFSKPGDIVTFSHRIATAGSPPSAVNPPTLKTIKVRSGPTYDYGFSSSQTFLCRFNPSKCYFDTRNELLPTYSGKTKSYDTKITIGKDTPENAQICYGTSVNPKNERGGEPANSGNQCTTVRLSPANSNQYNLIPSVSMEAASPSEAGELVTMSDQVRNSMKDESPETTWTAFAIEVRSGVDVAPLTSTSHDDKTPQGIADIVGKQPNGQPKATLIPAEDTNANKTGKTTVTGNASKTVGSRSFVLPEDAPVGTKFCFFLQVSPVASAGSPNTRTSAGKCITIGKKPKLNVYGGDLSVGRKFANDSSVPNLLKSSIHTSITVKNEEGKRKVYGSWTEYDAYAPGVVSGFATASGLQGGLETNSVNQSEWSKLTFVNVKNTFGSFSSSNTLGTIPDTAAAVTTGLPLAQEIPVETPDLDLGVEKGDLKNGIYRKENGNLNLKGSTLALGKTVVVSAPNGTVFIEGDLKYSSGPYTSLSQVPQLLIIAKNIVIKAPVTTVDAWLIAKAPVGSTGGDSTEPAGQISTCDAAGNLSTSVCNQPLTVTGPVMSNQLVLRRTAGLADPKKSDQPAEIFNLRADSYLWIYQQGTSNTRAITTYNRELPVRF